MAVAPFPLERIDLLVRYVLCVWVDGAIDRLDNPQDLGRWSEGCISKTDKIADYCDYN